MKRLAAGFLAAMPLLVAEPAVAHTGVPPVPGELWSVWNLDPLVLLGLGVSAMIYARGVGRLWRRAGQGRGIALWRFYCFVGGWAVLLLALVSPLDALGAALFSAHMAQHELLMLVAAPLLILGMPWVAALWAAPGRARRRIGALARHRSIESVGHGLAHPFSAWAIYAATLWIWHIPTLYEATLESRLTHALQHSSFLASALLFWWVLLRPGRSRRSAYGLGVLYIFTTGLHGSLLGALLTFSNSVWYPSYGPRVVPWGLTPLEDQHLAGLLMWIPPGFLYLAAAVWICALWLREIERRVGRREGISIPAPTSEPTQKDQRISPRASRRIPV